MGLVNGERTVKWKMENHGSFTLKSAYKMLNGDTGEDNPLWNKIWKLKLPQRCKTFMWLVLHNRLLTNDVRWRRGMSNSESCVCCNDNEAETILHALRNCSEVKVFWAHRIKPHLAERFFSSNLRDWCNLNLREKVRALDGEWHEFFVVSCWLLWQRRNEIIFDNRGQNQVIIVGKAHAIITSYNKAREKLGQVKLRGAANHTSNESFALTEGWVAAHSDGAFALRTGKAGCEGILGDHNGQYLDVFRLRLHEGDVLATELWSCLMCLR